MFSTSHERSNFAVATPLAVSAIDALRIAASVQLTGALLVEERSVWQPDSWLIQRCWESLADAGYSDEAMAVATLAAMRNPLAPAQVLQRLARQAIGQPELTLRIEGYLQKLLGTLAGVAVGTPTSNSADPLRPSIAQSPEGLLAAAAAGALIGNQALLITFLERLDQLPKAWERIFTHPEQRRMLSETVARAIPQPLINLLISSALRRFNDTGAAFLQEVASHSIAQSISTPLHSKPAQTSRLHPNQLRIDRRTILERCVDAFRFGMLATPLSQRLAIVTYGRAGLIEELLQQANTLTTILEARRHSGLDRQADANLVRQVKRPTANADADFQVYALTEAIRAMNVRNINRDERVALANRLATLSRRSDGWTAASAAHTLVELGALKFASEAVERIPPSDPTRVESVISLVRALLVVGEGQLADEQVEKALTWVKATEAGRNRAWALVRGLGEVYLAHNQPERTWQLLERNQKPATWLDNLRGWFGETWNDDDLRNQALRLRALLHPGGDRLTRAPKAIETLFGALRIWAPKLLEGEALVNFYVDGLLRPLLEAGLVSLVWKLLPEVQSALVTGTGDKHATRVNNVCTLLAEQTLPSEFVSNGTNAQELLGQFLQTLWKSDAQRGVWQIVHGIEGSLPLLLALDGAGAVTAIAQAASSVIVSAPGGVLDVGEG